MFVCSRCIHGMPTQSGMATLLRIEAVGGTLYGLSVSVWGIIRILNPYSSVPSDGKRPGALEGAPRSVVFSVSKDTIQAIMPQQSSGPSHNDTFRGSTLIWTCSMITPKTRSI